MAHLALYREFRPQRFSDVVGQQHITRTIRNALMQNRIHHAYLLSGPRGTGKTTVARLIAKAVNCLNPQDGEPCNECAACKSIMQGEAMDIIEVDAASNRGIDEIRDLRDKVKYAPVDLRRKVYIIDEVHMLSEPAFNALLKTLEEPPSHVLFVLATTEKHKLPITIVSRCQCFDYHRLSVPEIIGRLESVCEKCEVSATPEALTAIARQAEGGMRDALSLLDQVMAFGVDNKITLDDTLHVLGSAPLEQFLKLDGFLIQGDVGGALLLLDDLVRQGKDLRQFVRDYLGHLRDLLLLKVSGGEPVLDLPAQSLEALKAEAGRANAGHLLAAIKLLSQLEGDLRLSASPRLLVEVALIRLAALYTGQLLDEPAPQPAATVVRRPAAQPAAAAPPASATPAPAFQPGPAPVAPAAPGPEPETAPAPVPTGPVSAEQAKLMQVWDEVVGLVKKARPSTAPLVANARIGRVNGATVFVVAATETFAGLLKRPNDRDIIIKAFAKVGLPGLDVQVVGPDHPAAKGGWGADETAATAPQPSPERTLADIARSVFPQDLVHEVKEESK